MTYDERHTFARLCGCGRHLVTPSLREWLPLGCAFNRMQAARYGVIWAQPDREMCE